MKKITIKFLAIVLICISSNILSAQDYEIRTTHLGAGLVAVDVRFVGAGTEPTVGVDALLDFTIDLRWPAAANLDLAAPNNSGGYNISKAGVETVDGSEEYQGYFLTTAPTFLPITWTRDTWVEIFTVQSNSDGSTGETIEVGALGSNPVNPNIPNINMSGTDHTPAINGSAVLPAELINFEVRKVNPTSAKIFWSTASEQNTAHFNLQRSVDARSWENIVKIDAAGYSYEKLDYEYIDENISFDIRQSGMVYYRLEVIDFDEYREYSPVKTVEFETTENKLTVYPNPTRGFANIESSEELTSITIYNNQGERITASNNDLIDLNNFPSGIYLLQVETKKKVKFTRVIKTE